MLDRLRRERYSRQLPLPGVGQAGQEKLLSSKVLVVGAGGLGSAAAFYLAAAGVGTLGMIDGDRIELSNLQRQILHGWQGVGRLKVDSAAEAVGRLNPDVTVVKYPERLTAANAIAVMSPFDVVVSGVDNFPARYLMNDASLHLSKPVVHGSAQRFEGQATVVIPYGGPCYRCLYPEPPPPALAPPSAEAGILGAVPGIIGSVEAAEVVKLLLGVGEPLVSRVFFFDALAGEGRTLMVHRDPACPACSDRANPPALTDFGPLEGSPPGA